jgi:2-succinyl-5-enolpyruvyl-6-hydroxy-3-cyclohexene-1-carboxylate synthase
MSSQGDTAATFCATLVDEWARQGVRHAVVAPGSRSTPLAVALARNESIEVHVFHDERSASFAALGIGTASGFPAVLLCTSGTAATHFHGAVVEAHQSDVPMIVCTADRPPELRDVGAAQTIDQTRLFGTAVRWFHDPGVPSRDAATTWRSLASRTVQAAVGARPGPVHLNLPFREPLTGDVVDMPASREKKWSEVVHLGASEVQDLSEIIKAISGRRGVIIAGRGASRDVLSLSEALGWPIFADAVSGVREPNNSVVIGFDAILRSELFATSHVPEVVLRIGAPPASKVLAQWIKKNDCRIVQIRSTEMVSDPDHMVEFTVVGDVATTTRVLAAAVTPCDKAWILDWADAETRAQKAISEWTFENFSEPSIARTVTSALSVGSHLVVSSSMPIRDVEWFGTTTPGVTVHSNRGTNGIDGVISTAVGVAIASKSRVTVLIGDVACLHDSNGLWALSRRDVDLTIVVTNNDGGSIFSFLPQAQIVSNSDFELLYGTPHGASFEHLAATHGIAYERVASVKDLETTLQRTGTRLIEVPCDRLANVAQHESLNSAVVAAVEATA